MTAGEKDLEAYLLSWKEKRSSEFPWAHEREIAIVPMPLSEARERERGFNQSEWISERLRASIMPDAKIVKAVVRISSSTPQATIQDRELRSANVRGGFVAAASVPDAVVLVDDVMTTGATCREVARVLMESGTKKIYVFTLALGK
jgi:ComF family protein